MTSSSPGALGRRRAPEIDSQSSLSTLTDDRASCLHADVPYLLTQIREQLEASGVAARDCIALELTNDLRSALLVLALLDAGFDFVALPARGQGARSVANDVEMPGFCRWILAAAPAAGTSSDVARPASWLKLQSHAEFQGSAPASADGEPRLFFRTSGSLSTPKLVAKSHAAVLDDAALSAATLRITPALRVALPLPIYHAFGLGVGLLASYLGGASLDLQERSNVLRFLERERSFDPNVALLTPSLCKMLLRARRRPRPYRFMLVGGDLLGEEFRARLAKLHGPVLNGYGSTEMGFQFVTRPTQSDTPGGRSIGEPLPGVDWRLEALEGLAESGGELLVRSPRGFVGYVTTRGEPLDSPARTQQHWYRTGDLATLDAEGRVEILGRCSLSCNRNGVLVPFADIEDRLRGIPGIGEAVVVGGGQGMRGRELFALCTLDAGAALSEISIRTACESLMPAYAIPDHVRLISQMPLLPNGKVDRRSLASLAAIPEGT